MPEPLGSGLLYWVDPPQGRGYAGPAGSAGGAYTPRAQPGCSGCCEAGLVGLTASPTRTKGRAQMRVRR